MLHKMGQDLLEKLKKKFSANDEIWSKLAVGKGTSFAGIRVNSQLMNPLQISKTRFLDLKGHRVRVICNNIESFGVITTIIMHFKPPQMPASFDIELDLKSKEHFIRNRLIIPYNFSLSEVSDIQLA